MGLLTKMLLPLVIIILLILVVGIVVVPFLVAAIFVLGLVGKVAVLEAIGFSVGRMTGKKEIEAPLVALIVGSVILALLYMIPVIGLLTMLLLSVWSLGCALTAAFRGFRREVPESKPAYVPAPAYTPAIAAAPASVFPGSGTTGIYQAQTANAAASGSSEFQATGTMGTSAGATTAAATPMPGDPPVMPEVLIYPKATFWERIGAAFLDFVLVMILGHVVGSITFTMIIGLAYVTALWTLKGTTIGGIVLGLKVVRMDGRPVTFAVSLVRGLAAGFSAVVLFLGFLWILWDPDRQGWHDKIAGTVVLRLPRGTPLVCV